MKKILLILALFVSVSFAGWFDDNGYNDVTINAITITTANTVYTVDAADPSRSYLRVTRVGADVYMTIGNSSELTSLNYGILLTSTYPVYEINADNYTQETISAMCVTGAETVLVLRGRRTN